MFLLCEIFKIGAANSLSFYWKIFPKKGRQSAMQIGAVEK
jgi:hypothetical protein